MLLSIAPVCVAQSLPGRALRANQQHERHQRPLLRLPDPDEASPQEHEHVIPRAIGQLGKDYVPPPPLPDAPAGITRPTADAAPPLSTVTLQSLLELAGNNNPTLRQARAQVGGALGTAIQAGLYPNPELAYVAEQIGVMGTPGEFQGALFRQEIVTAGKLRLSREKFLQRVAVAEAQAVAQQYRVCNDIRWHFYDALGHAELVRLHQQLVNSAHDTVLTSRELYNVGQANRADVLRANVKLQRARLDLLAAENRYQQAHRRLTSLVGVELAAARLDGALDGRPQLMEFDKQLARLWQNSPQLLAAQAKLRGDQITVARERVQPVPNVRVEAGSGYNFEARETVAAAGVSVSVPLWDRNQGTIQQAQADVARQQAEVERIRWMLRRSLADTFARYTTAVQHVIQYQQVILPESREAYRTLLKSYQDDRVAWVEVLDAQRDYIQSQAEYINILVDWRQSEVLIQGMLLRGGLEPAAGPTPPGHIDATPRPR